MLDFKNIIRIAYLGPTASFTEMAKDEFCDKLGINAYPEPCQTIKQVIEFASQNPNTLGVLPLDNSIQGTVRETLDNLLYSQNSNMKILSECFVPANYCLLSKTTEVYSIYGIISPPDLLAKCSSFIKEEMPYNPAIIEASSMPEAARELQNHNLTYASIGNHKTAEIFNLNVLKENINDEPSITKFVLIGDFDTEETNDDATSIAFRTENTPGALLKVLNIFMQNHINLSYIASHHSKTNFEEYVFVIEFDGHIKNPQVAKTLEEIKEFTTYIRIFGSYQKNQFVL